MKNNYLSIHMDSLFKECTLLNANLFITDTFLKERVNQLKTNFPIKGYELISMGSSFRDLSKKDEGNNLFTTKKKYSLITDDLDFEINRILSYHSCITISQVFEVFESFLKDILTEIIFRNHIFSTIINLKVENFGLNEIRYSLYGIQGKNNHGFIKAIRKLSQFFKHHETNNIWGLNMTDWYKLIAIIRHITVHQRQKVSDDLLQKIKSEGLEKLFKRHFKLQDNILFLTPYESDAIINHLYEYAFLIYKGLSVDLELEFKEYKSY